MKIDIDELARVSRPQDCKGTIQVLSHNRMVFYSWGPQAFTNFKDKVLRFKVNGHHHKGHVYIVVNGADLFDVYLTTTRGTIVKEMNDIYFDELQERIDTSIERIDEYVD